MKKLFFIIIILFKIQFTANADDIMDFELEGMSIGDSLLTYFSNEEIQSMEKVFYPGSDKYIQIEPGRLAKLDFYESVNFLVKKNDKKLIIHSITAGVFFDNDINKCLEQKENTLDDLKSTFKNSKLEEYDFKYEIDDGKSIAYINAFTLNNNDRIRIWCVNWSKATEEKRNFTDNLAVSIEPRYILDWLTYEANQ